MIELPEALTLANQLKNSISGKTVSRVNPPTKPHKFCWFNGDACDYDSKIKRAAVKSADAFGIFAELVFDNGEKLCVNDGVNVRLIKADRAPKDYQLMIAFDDGNALCFSVAMYGGIVLHSGSYDNEYYLKSKSAISPFANSFSEYFDRLAAESKPTLSAKAFIATEQRFAGVGNGVAQDILFTAHIHPKRKLNTFSPAELELLKHSIISVLRDMTDKGGRDTEKNIYGSCGGYKTLMSKNSLADGCPVCGGEITKESYLGGSVYYCKHCQPIGEK